MFKSRNMYYQIGILDGFTGDEIHQCVTKAPLFVQPVLDKVVSLLEDQFGKDITIVWDEVDGEMPTDKDTIKPYVKQTKYSCHR